MENGDTPPDLSHPDAWEYLPMTGDNSTDILARLERLDAGQRYIIERMGEMRAEQDARDIRADATRDDLRYRIHTLEEKDAARDRASQPWHNLMFYVAGALAVSLLTLYVAHLMSH